LVNIWTGERVPVAAPVVSGYSTYLSLREVGRLSIHLRVLDGGRTDKIGRSDVRVNRAGISTEGVRSDKSGLVSISNQLVAVPYPIYLDLHEVSSQGFPQRVRVTTEEVTTSHKTPVELSFLPARLLNDLISQLEPSESGSAPIHPTSGMVLAAWDGSRNVSQGEVLYPVDHPLDQTATLEPEVYFVDGDNRLSVQGSVARNFRRAMTVQVDPGLHKMTLSDEQAGRDQWGELAVVSTGVVSLLRTGYQY
jgi:hypothetical protein